MCGWRKFNVAFVAKCSFLLGGVLCEDAAFAITDSRINSGTVFNFSTPGARSLALGGAFLGLADDATAAYANPAGLTALSRPQVSIELRSWDVTRVFSDRGRASGKVTGIVTDTIDGVQETEAAAGVEDVSFFSVAFPSKKWVVSFYRHSLANVESERSTDGVFFERLGDGQEGEVTSGRTAPELGAMDLEILSYGLSVAYDFGELSLGVGLSHHDLLMVSDTEVFRRFPLGEGGNEGEITDPGSRYGPPNYERDFLISTKSERGDSGAWSFNAGLHWEFLENWSIGGVYRQGADFDLDATFLLGKASLVDEKLIALACRCVPEFGHTTIDRLTEFHVPDFYGLGVAYRPTENIRFMVDLNVVEYSDMLDGLIDPLYGPRPEEISPFLSRPSLVLDDTEELHVGLEYFLLQRSVPLAFRFGAWHEPDHSIRYEGELQAQREITWRPGEDQVHYSFGIGISTRKLQIDVAFDYSKQNRTTSVSTVYRF